jgi:hypothetical protein
MRMWPAECPQVLVSGFICVLPTAALDGGGVPETLKGSNGGRTRDRTLDLSRVKGTLSR